MSSSASSAYAPPHKRAEQSRWTSPRVAARRTEEDGKTPKATRSGSAASRWADPPAVEQAAHNDASAARNGPNDFKTPRRNVDIRPTTPAAPRKTVIARDGAHAAPTRDVPSPISKSMSAASNGNDEKNNGEASRAHAASLERLLAGSDPVGNPAAHLGTQLSFMSLISSPSRGMQGYEVSSIHGLSREDQDLTNRVTQAKYRLYISKRIHDHCLKFPSPLKDLGPLVPDASAFAADVQNKTRGAARASLEEILLLVRKLREGLSASHREDEATIEVYHLSLFLSLFTLNTAQLSSTLHRLVLDLYRAIPTESGMQSSTWPSSITRDFASLQSSSPSCKVFAQLKLFEDSPEARSHAASLLLLSHTCLADAASTARAFQDDFHSLRYKVMEAAGLDPTDKHITLAHKVEVARRDLNPYLLRRVMKPPTVSTYQHFVIFQIIPKFRLAGFGRLRKSYVNVPLPVNGCDDEQWLEKLLLIDDGLPSYSMQHMMAQAKASAAAVAAAGGLTNAFDSLSLRDDDERAERLAGVFTLCSLPYGAPDPKATQAAPVNILNEDLDDQLPAALQPWKTRFVFDSTKTHLTIKIR